MAQQTHNAIVVLRTLMALDSSTLTILVQRLAQMGFILIISIDHARSVLSTVLPVLLQLTVLHVLMGLTS